MLHVHVEISAKHNQCTALTCTNGGMRFGTHLVCKHSVLCIFFIGSCTVRKGLAVFFKCVHVHVSTYYPTSFSSSLYLSWSFDKRQINPRSSLRSSSRSFIQRCSAPPPPHFPSLRVDLYILHTKELRLNSSSLAPLHQTLVFPLYSTCLIGAEK